MANFIDDHNLPGIGPGRRRRLKEAGYESLEQLVEAGPDTLSKIPHLHAKLCQDLVNAASNILQNLNADSEAKTATDNKEQSKTAASEEAETPQTSQAEHAEAAPEAHAEAAPEAHAEAAPEAHAEAAPEARAEAEESSTGGASGLRGMDRVSASRRPDRRAAGQQKWRELLFVHWPVPVSALRPLIPERLSIDTYDGVAYIGIVPFSMKDVWPTWAPFGLDFLETNVRTYVHLDGKDPGVWFFSLEAASRLAVKAARWGWSLPYYHARMSSQRSGDTIHYTTRRSKNPEATFSVDYTIGEALQPSEDGTLQHFLLERYYLYSIQRGRLRRGQVHHAPYPAYSASVERLQDGLVSAAGLPAVQGPPPIVHYSPGVDVDVFSLEKV